MTMHAILVGIDHYPESGLPSLEHSVEDAKRIKKFLGADEDNIRVLQDSEATKDGITKALQSLSDKAKRNDAIVFFFSGYAGSLDGEDDAVICPCDIQSAGGLSVKSLLRTFDLLSKRFGNNITVFLDGGGDALKWDNPSSCVVVYPTVPLEDDRGGLFTSAIIEVLEAQRDPLSSLPITVETFAKRVESSIAKFVPSLNK
ncbi:hypothetical protein GYMLUDRAFT_462027 [Collybiopsis luxurians FD-317 M1]|uniref:Peptidase C14 caspase domain-containing protein n=1 Tax=Collybiopsis luxurians FD-317 M1 TaxID=944289 RepID=A0A0D0C6K7_9AGAR|nr:hypothetical protein GYMLUDRAFT_462027 [Collybiopsis luxurians FD-317 M1]